MQIRKVIELWKGLGEDPTGYETDDTANSDLLVYEQLIQARATIVKDRDKPGAFSDAMVQTIQCVQFEEVDAVECNLAPQSGCIILKSTCNIPNMLKLVSVNQHLGKNIEIVRWDRLPSKLNSRVKQNQLEPYAAIRNLGGKQFLYIINDEFFKSGSISGIVEDPIEAYQFCGNTDATCEPMSIDFHTDLKYQDAVLKLTWDTILRLRSSTKPDIVNDDSVIQ